MRTSTGEIVALLGRNGVGRSTMAKAILGMVKAEGSVRLRGEEILGRRTFEIAHAGIGYVPENRDIFPTLTVRQNLLLAKSAIHGRPSRAGAWTTCTACFRG
jgi:branched-chain amino acid transport system ATP-binding protein